MSALRADDFAPEPNRYAATNASIVRVKRAAREVLEPWAKELGRLDAALDHLEDLAFNDRVVGAGAVGPIAVTVLRVNPKAQLRRLRAGGSPIEAQSVVYAALGPILVHRTYKKHPDQLDRLIRHVELQQPKILDAVDTLEEVIRHDPLNRIQIWNQQAIESAENTLKTETDLDSQPARAARAVLIKLRCGPVTEQELDDILSVSGDDDFLTYWEQEVDEAGVRPHHALKVVRETSPHGKRGGVRKVTLIYEPTPADIDRAQKIMNQVEAGQVVPSGSRQRAQVILAFAEDPYVSRPELAERLGINAAIIHLYRKEFTDREGFTATGRTKTVGRGSRMGVVQNWRESETSEPEAIELVVTKLDADPETAEAAPEVAPVYSSRKNELYAPSDEDTALAESIINGSYTGTLSERLNIGALVIMAIEEDAWLSAEELAKTVGATPELVNQLRREFNEDGGFKAERPALAPEAEEPKARTAGTRTRPAKRVIEPTEEQVAYAESVLQQPEPDKLQARAHRRMAQMVVALHNKQEISNAELAALLGVTDGRIPQMRGELITKGFGPKLLGSVDIKVEKFAAPTAKEPKAKVARVARERERLTYEPSDEEVVLATSITDRVNSGEVVPKGQRVRAQLILGLRENPVLRPELADKIGIARNETFRYRKEFVANGGFKIELKAKAKAKVKIATPRLESVESAEVLLPTSEIVMPPVSRRAEAKRIGETKQSELVRLPSRDVVLQWRPTEEEVAIAKSVLENTYSGSDEPFSRSRQAELVLGFHEVNLSISALANGIAVTPAPAAVERPKAAETKPLQAPSRQLLSGYIPSEAHFNGANEVLRSGTVRLSVARQARVVRTLYKDPTTPLGEIADEEGVSYERIRQICVDLKQNGFEVKQSQLS